MSTRDSESTEQQLPLFPGGSVNGTPKSRARKAGEIAGWLAGAFGVAATVLAHTGEPFDIGKLLLELGFSALVGVATYYVVWVLAGALSNVRFELWKPSDRGYIPGLVIGLFAAALLVYFQLADNDEPLKPIDLSPPPNLTATQAKSLVDACFRNAALIALRQFNGYYEAEYQSQGKQWIVTVWANKEASERYLGTAYVVDDISAEVLNCPPAYKP